MALSYVDSDVTAAIYRNGTIGRAKDDLEATATRLNQALAAHDGAALISVNGAMVTQAATAIPGIPLYASLLRGVLGGARLDDWELDDGVQAQLRDRWKQVTTANLGDLADAAWFRAEVRRLYGFDVPGVDYQAPVEVDLPWPT